MGGVEKIDSFSIEQVERRKTPIAVTFDTAKGLIGEETLRLDSLQGTEAVSQLFEFQLEMRGNDIKTGKQLSIGDFLGRPAVVEVIQRKTEKAVTSEDPLRYFNGIVSQFSIAQPGVYRATIKPTLWRASLTNRYRVYHHKNISEALAIILDAHNVNYEMHFDGVALDRYQDWLQAGETDLDFMQRLMEKANIYYYFVHKAESHTMILANRPHYEPIYKTGGRLPKLLQLKFTNTSEVPLGIQSDDILTEYNYEQNFTTTGVDFLLARSEAAWESDEIAGYSTYQKSFENINELPFRQYKVYQYGGSKEEVASLSRKSWHKISAAATGLNGSSSSPLLSAGHVFMMAEDSELKDSPDYGFEPETYYAPNRTVRANLNGEKFVVTQVQHKASDSELYSNSFQATEAAGLITPFNIQNTQQGAILAKVVAHGGAVSPIGWKYREKDNFAFDKQGAHDHSGEETLFGTGVYVEFITDQMVSIDGGPVWIKLAQSMQTVPEIGVVVTVARSSDESEMPEIQGIVQSNGSKVIMPSFWTANTMVGSSYSTSYGDGKSIRYGKNSATNLDEAKGIIEAQYATGLFRDSSYSKGGGYSFSTTDNDKDGLISRSESHGSSDNESYALYSIGHSEVDYSFSSSIVGDAENYSIIDKDSFSASVIEGDSVSSQRVAGSSVNSSEIGASKSYSTVLRDTKSYSTILGKSYSENTLGTPSGNTGKILSLSKDGLKSLKNLSAGQALDGVLINKGVGDSADLLQDMAIQTDWVSENINTVHGNSRNSSTTIGDTLNESTTIGNSETNAINLGNNTNTSLTVGAHDNTNLFLGAKSDVELSLAATMRLALTAALNNSINISASVNNSLNLSASINNSIDISAAMQNAIELNAAMINKIEGAVAMKNILDLNGMLTKTKTTPLEVVTEPANVKCRIGNIDLEIMTFKIFM